MYKFKVTNFLFGLMTLGLSVLITACSSDGEERPEYLDAGSVNSLEIPPRLTSPDTRGAMRLPEPSAEAKAKFSVDASDPIAPEFEGMRLENEEGVYFLEIDSPVSEVWASLPEFLASEGIEVERVEKLMGFVDTRWMDEYQVSFAGQEGGSWFKAFSPDYKDKFRIRVEPAGDGKDKTRLYVAHRGMQIVVVEDGTKWQQRQSEAILEREILYRFMLYSGAEKQTATAMLANYKSYQPRAKENKQASSFTVQGEPSAVWLRMRMAMDRLGVELLQADESRGEMLVKVGQLKDVKVVSEEESSWFGRLFSGKDIVVDEDDGYETPEYKKQPVAKENQITLKVKQQVSETSSVITASYEDGRLIKQGLALDFRNALFEQLK